MVATVRRAQPCTASRAPSSLQAKYKCLFVLAHQGRPCPVGGDVYASYALFSFTEYIFLCCATRRAAVMYPCFCCCLCFARACVCAVLCCRYGVAVGAACAPLVRVLMWVFSPVTWPLGKLLDRILGHEEITMKRKELKAMVTLHGEGAGAPASTTAEFGVQPLQGFEGSATQAFKCLLSCC